MDGLSIDHILNQIAEYGILGLLLIVVGWAYWKEKCAKEVLSEKHFQQILELSNKLAVLTTEVRDTLDKVSETNHILSDAVTLAIAALKRE
jgi:hypothetical protein